MNPSDLTGRDLDLAVTKALGYQWWENRSGVTYLRKHERPPESFAQVDAPGPEYGSPWLPGYDCDGGRIPELFAEIRRRTNDCVDLILRGSDHFAFLAASGDHQAHASTPNEALARLLLMVTGPVP